MSTIGIDFGQTATVACLRDGDWPSPRWRDIGDGARVRIPNAAESGGRWGSDAVRAGVADSSSRQIAIENTSWLEGPLAQIFWAGLIGRIASFLGRVEPVARNGYQVVIAPQTSSFLEASGAIERLGNRRAIESLEAAICIPAQRALLCRWMAAQQRSRVGCVNLVAVMVGDVMLTAGAYQVEFRSDASPKIIHCGYSHHVSGTGSAWWEQWIASQISERANIPIPAARALEVRDATIALANRLRTGDPDLSIRWHGPLSENMYHPFEIGRQQMRNLKEVLTLGFQLPDAIRQALASLGSQPDLILLGGSGACWPFAADTLATSAGFARIPIWQSSNPIEDLAKGAALWPVFSSTAKVSIWTDEQEPNTVPLAAVEQLPGAPISLPNEARQPIKSRLREGTLLSQWTKRPEAQPHNPEEEI